MFRWHVNEQSAGDSSTSPPPNLNYRTLIEKNPGKPSKELSRGSIFNRKMVNSGQILRRKMAVKLVIGMFQKQCNSGPSQLGDTEKSELISDATGTVPLQCILDPQDPCVLILTYIFPNAW